MDQGEHDMSDNQVTWEKAAASVGVSAHGSYNLERALKDAGYVKFEYDFEHLENGGYRILDKRVKESKGPWFVDGLMGAEDWKVLQPIALQAVADMREVQKHVFWMNGIGNCALPMDIVSPMPTTTARHCPFRQPLRKRNCTPSCAPTLRLLARSPNARN